MNVSASRWTRRTVAVACCAVLAGCSSMKSTPRQPSTDSPLVNYAGSSASTGDSPRRDEAALALVWARSLEQQGKLDDARRMYERAMDFPKHQGEAAHRLANLHVRSGELELAEPLYRQALKARPRNADLLADYGYACYLQTRWVESQQLYERALAIDPKHARAHNNLGLTLASQGRDEEALKEFHHAGLQRAEARVNLAMVKLGRGQADAARASIQEARQLDPNLPALRRLVAHLPSGLVESLADKSKTAESLANESRASEQLADEALADEPLVAEPLAAEPLAYDRVAAEPTAAKPVLAKAAPPIGAASVPSAHITRARSVEPATAPLVTSNEPPTITWVDEESPSDRTATPRASFAKFAQQLRDEVRRIDTGDSALR